ncbi:MAG: ABC transporter substrate-binding protein [Rhodospirillaceae bacterium]|nr:ABC transporter substrate-binding protein [Rhodospirillaceae bacterium]
MKTIRLMLSALAVVALTLVAQGLSKANAEEMGDPISIGFNAPLSGPVAGWGLPGLTGLKILADWHNAEGGILVGNTRHKLVIDQFDNEYVPSKALQGAKRLVFEHDSKMLLGVGGSTGDTQIPFLTENGVFYASLATTDINPNRPYVIAGEDAFPRGEIMRPFYIKSVYKGLKTYAVI